MKWSALFLSLSIVAIPLRAAANEGGVAVSLVAPEGCPARDVLLASAQRRAAWIHFSDVPEPLGVDVHITKAARGFAATIALTSGEGTESRSLNAVTCGELVDASGLLIALFVKADAEARESPPAPVTPPVLVPAAPAPAPAEVATPAAPIASRPWTPFVGAQLQSEVAVLPALSSGGALFAGLERSSGLLAPSVRLEASVTTSDLAAGPSREGSFLRAVARADGCPLRFSLSPWATLRPCVWAGLGLVHAAGAEVPRPLSQTNLWAEVGARLRARAESSRLFMELEAGAVMPITRPSFLIETPRSVVYATPAVGALVAIGGGVRFL